MNDNHDWLTGDAGVTMVYTKHKAHVLGWTMPPDRHNSKWVARSIKGTRAEFDTEEEAKDFLNFLLTTET